MLRSYICRQCRARLIPRELSLRNPQWQPRATFISFSKGDEQPTPQEAQGSPRAEPASNASPSVEEEKSKIRRIVYSKDANSEARNPPNRLGRYSQYAQESREGQPGLYQGTSSEQPGSGQRGNIIQRTEVHTKTGSKSAAPRGPKIIHVGTQKSHTAQIQRHLENGNLGQAWTAFEKDFTSKDSAAFSEPSFTDAKHMNQGSIFGLLLQRINEEFCRGAEVPKTPTEVLFHFEKLGIMRNEYWYQTISKLTHEMLFAISGTPEAQINSDALLAELTSVWRLFFQCNGSNDAPLNSIAVEWETLPDAGTLSKPGLGIGGFKTASFGPRLQTFHARCVGNSTLGFCAVTYFNLFDSVNQDVLQISDSVREQGVPFLRLLTHILAGSVVDPVLKHSESSSEFQALPEEFRVALIDQIKSAPSEAMLTISSGGNTADPPSPEQRAANQEEVFRRRINKLILQQVNSARLEQTWEEILQVYGPNNPNNSQGMEGKIPESLYNALLSGFMALFQPQRSVEVWNHMVASGIRPNVRMWTAMLDGCSKARDLDGFNTLWARFQKSGIEPDDYAWTTRVNALIERFNLINDGFAAMDEMGRRWLTAETAIKNPRQKQPSQKGKKALPKMTVNPYTKPTIEVINGAIAGFSRAPQRFLTFQQRKEYAQKVLKWAANFKLKPDHITYNTLISIYLRGGEYTTAFKLIAQMEKEDIAPDAYTYTMLIRSAFTNQKFADLSDSEQSTRVISTFNELESSGVKLNQGIYGVVIDKFLKDYQNFEAVRAVITHMMARDLQPNHYIYTSLITEYFQQSPPNIAAVDSLWMQILATMGTTTDKMFFDRIVEGYARCNEVTRMMDLLARMEKEGKQPSWNALTAVVTALGKAGDWEKLNNVVRDVQKKEGVGQGVTGPRNHMLMFFHVVVDKLGIDLGQAGKGVVDRERKLNVREMVDASEELVGKSNEGKEVGKRNLKDFGKGMPEDLANQAMLGENRIDGADGVEGSGEERDAQDLWNEQLNSLETEDVKEEDLVGEDNGSRGGVPL